jgi:hypothetical protein
MLTNAEIDALVEAELAAELQAEKARRRAAIAERLRRAEDRKWYDEIDRRYLIRSANEAKLEPERRRIMAERAAQANREMDEANARVVDGTLRAQRAAAAGGRSGFRFK